MTIYSILLAIFLSDTTNSLNLKDNNTNIKQKIWRLKENLF